MSKKINIGLDVGIASIGWSVLDVQNKKILNAGSHLFDEVGNGNSAADTRMHRGSRRLLRRSKLRKRDLLNLYVNQGFISNKYDFFNFNSESNLLDIRKKATSEKIHLKELLIILYNYMKHRGTFSYIDDLVVMNEKLTNTDVSFDDLNKSKDGILPVDKHINFVNEFGRFRGKYGVDNLIDHVDYKKELELIFNIQIKNNVVKEDFKNKYFEIYDRKRNYYDGPGMANKKSEIDSKWGWKGNKEEFFNRLIGFDKYVNENEKRNYRHPKHALTSYIFNILNDINNMKFKNITLTKKDRETIINNHLTPENGKTKNVTIKELAKLLKIKEDDITGYRLKSDNKSANITSFELYNELRNNLIKNGLDWKWINISNWDLLDKIGLILTKYQSYNDRIEELQKTIINKITNEPDKIISIIAFSKKSGTHSMSKENMDKCIDLMFEFGLNHVQALNKLNLKITYNVDFKNNDSINTIPVLSGAINEMYISPVAKRAFIQTLKIIKEIEKEYVINSDYKIDNVIIEMAREKNSKEQKNNIIKMQNINKNSKELIKKTYQLGDNLSGQVLEKLSYLVEQDGKCIYSGKPIDIERLKTDFNYCEIDHIIPFSISFDNSKSNKVLCLNEENQAKGKKTPFMYLNENQYKSFETRSIEMCKNLEKSDKKYAINKLNNLTHTGNIHDLKENLKFISRNLNDTRYAMNEVKDYLTFFSKELDKKWKILTINGKFTNYLRRGLFKLEQKDRNNNKHHAVDATLMTIVPLIKFLKNLTIDDFFSDRSYENSTYEENDVLDFNRENNELATLRNQINNFNYKFTKKVSKRINTSILDDTIYSAKEINGKMLKRNTINLIEGDEKILRQIFLENSIEVEMKKSDLKTFEYLKSIFLEFIGKEYVNVNGRKSIVKNPFDYYVNVLKNKLIKQSNEKRPPEIKKLRYFKGDPGSFLSITHKYKNAKEKKIVYLKSFKAVAWDLFYSSTYDKYKILPIDCRVANFGNIKSSSFINDKIVTNKYNEFKGNLKIDETYIFKYRLFKNNEIEFTKDGKFYSGIYISGFSAPSKVEIKYLSHKTEEKDRSKNIISIEKIKNFKIINSNILKTKIKKIS